MDSKPPGQRPIVSVILATLNEAAHIRECISSLLDQQTPNFDLEILAVDGLSEDGTREILDQIAAAEHRVKVLVNQRRTAPFAFNLGLKNARGQYVCIFGSHTLYSKDYISVCLNELQDKGAVGCGGRVITEPGEKTLQARLIASALRHPFGSSRKSFRTQPEGFVDTVNYAVIKKSTLLEVGGYAEELSRNQDNDVNQKLRARGHKLFCTWKTHCIYHPRATVKDLWNYAYRSGFWNIISLKINPASMAFRHIMPSLFVGALLSTFVLAAAGQILHVPQREFVAAPFVFLLALHLGIGLISALHVMVRDRFLAALWLPLIFLSFHFAYGFGAIVAFLTGATASGPVRQNPPGHESTSQNDSAGVLAIAETQPPKKTGQNSKFDSVWNRLRGVTAWFDLYSRTNQVILDGCAIASSLVGAYMIRFEGWPQRADLSQLLFWLPILVFARLIVHYVCAIYRQVWRFISFSDAVEIGKSIVVVSVMLLTLRLVYPASGSLAVLVKVPISIIALEGLLALTSSMSIRMLRRSLYARARRAAVSRKPAVPPKRVLLYGAGRAGMMLRRELETSRAYEVVGFVDDDPRKIGSVICNTHVVCNGDGLERFVKTQLVDEIIISMATATRQTLARTLSKCRRARVPAKIIPSFQEILSGNVRISQIRETRMEDVLGRECVAVPEYHRIVGSAYRAKRVLVTGAGGSIGGELVRQLVALAPSKIAILDKDENAVYELEQELRLLRTPVPIEPHIADVRDLDRVRAVFEGFHPQFILHAAAHKHVPLMEMHPCEAVLNNVGGTKNMLMIAAEFGAERFVFISSDKAVNPVNVMGATKRIGEMLVQASVNATGLRAGCVRFGNVLGSRGSVIPLFQKQIAEGGPVTVTHPDMVRYFMTIQEAVQLILCAGARVHSGEIFVLDMGKPRKILELARELISLSGFEPERDIQTKITGLRPGEKLVEELVAPSERVLRTELDKLAVIQSRPFDEDALLADIARLLQSARSNDRIRVHELLSSMGLGFRSQFLPPKPRESATDSAPWKSLSDSAIAADAV